MAAISDAMTNAVGGKRPSVLKWLSKTNASRRWDRGESWCVACGNHRSSRERGNREKAAYGRSLIRRSVSVNTSRRCSKEGGGPKIISRILR